jgi:hypothetical protein
VGIDPLFTLQANSNPVATNVVTVSYPTTSASGTTIPGGGTFGVWGVLDSNWQFDNQLIGGNSNGLHLASASSGSPADIGMAVVKLTTDPNSSAFLFQCYAPTLTSFWLRFRVRNKMALMTLYDVTLGDGMTYPGYYQTVGV